MPDSPEAVANYVCDMDFSLQEMATIVKILVDYMGDFE